MSTKLNYLIGLVTLALIMVLLDHNIAWALPLDPSEIKVAEIVQDAWQVITTYPKTSAGVAGTAVVELVFKPIRTIIFADGHTERK